MQETGVQFLGLGRYPGGKHDNPLQYFCLENSMDRGNWWATVHRVAKSWTWLKWLSTHTYIYTSMYTCAVLCLVAHSSMQPPGPHTARQAPLSMGILQARILESVAMPSSRRSSQHCRSPTLQADFLSSEPPGKPKNTGVGSLSLLQGTFLTQESESPALQADSLPV